MEEVKFKSIEEDGVVVYDESDDFVPGETQILDEEDELDTNYLQRETARQEVLQTEERRRHRYISVGVIAAVVAFIAGVCYIKFRSVL